jgi:uncharacterized protein
MTGIRSIGSGFLAIPSACLRLFVSLAVVTTLLGSYAAAEPKSLTDGEFSKLLTKAQSGSLNAQNEVAKAYASGRRGNANYEEAARWYRRAADQGDPDAQTNLGVLYLLGRGVAHDDTQALRWFQRAAASDYPLGLHDLGIMYNNGWGVAKDPQHALELLLRAANAGVEVSQVNVALAYMNGGGVPQDPSLAVRWLKRAVKHGFAPANFILGIAYETGRGTDPDARKAAELYRKAAEQNLAEAQNNLGRLYLQGSGVPRDTREALRLFSAAANQGNGQSYVNLALCYLVACASVVDPIAAYSWYLSARSSGIPIPQHLSERLSAIGDQLSEEQHQRAELDSQKWIAQHPAVDPRSPVQLNQVPGPAVAMDQPIRPLTNDEVLKASWHQTPYTPQTLPIQHSVR